MKKIGLIMVLALVSLLLPKGIFAQNACNYQSTQARVQNNIKVPWSKEIYVGCEKTFNVGSFHDGTGQFATDTWLYVYGPNNFGAYFQNGQTVNVPNDGTYYLNVTTGPIVEKSCSESAVVNVACASPAPTPKSTPPSADPNVCQYQNTQARVQKSVNEPWEQKIKLSCGDRFNVGSFHDQTGQFAGDTELLVRGPSLPLGILVLNHKFQNGQPIRAWFPGTYTLEVTTVGQSGGACSEQAAVEVTCPMFWWE